MIASWGQADLLAGKTKVDRLGRPCYVVSCWCVPWGAASNGIALNLFSPERRKTAIDGIAVFLCYLFDFFSVARNFLRYSFEDGQEGGCKGSAYTRVPSKASMKLAAA